MKFGLYNQDCIEWMNSQPRGSVDCIITSPPYNLDIKYGKYHDDLPRAGYLKWLSDVAQAMQEILTADGQIFLNVGYSNVDPWVAMDVAQVFRQYFVLQNNFTWVKHILVNDRSHGIYKPITSDRFASATTESIYHFTKTGQVKIDRLAIGHRNATHEKYPELYSPERHFSTLRRKISRRLGFKNWTELKLNATPEIQKKFQQLVEEQQKSNPYDPTKKKCIGNAWYIPYTPTSKLSKQAGASRDSGSREKGRGNHPATYPQGLSTQCIKFSGIPLGSKVYDPFVGTGTTIISALTQGMMGLGTDIDQDYLDFAKHRIQMYFSDTI